MKLSNLTVERRLFLLGLFSNALLALAVCMGAYASWRVSLNFEAANAEQDAIGVVAEAARETQLAFWGEAQELNQMLLAAGEAQARERHRVAMEQSAERVDAKLAFVEAQLRVLGAPAESATEARAEHARAAAVFRDAAKVVATDAAAATTAERSTRTAERAVAERLDDLGDKARVLGAWRLKEDRSNAEEERVRTLIYLAILTAFALMVSMGVGMANTRSIVPPLRSAVAIAQAVASGDLTREIDSTRGDELGQLLRSLKEMNASLLEIVTRVQDEAQGVMSASEQIAADTANLSGRTEAQASSLEETAASIEQMTATVDQNAQHARRANDLASNAAAVAQRGGAMVLKMVARMDEIQASSRKISEIIGLIDSIAFQTNILALNAAVEAARAGESGRGFAVVATEVRSLAQRSAEAARQIKDLIHGAVEAVNAGATLADDAGRTMVEVTGSVNEVSQVIGQIATATAEQQMGVSQINQAVTELDRVTQKNASMAHDSLAASENLRRLAERLDQAASFFKVRGGDDPAPGAQPQVAEAPSPGSPRLTWIPAAQAD